MKIYIFVFVFFNNSISYAQTDSLDSIYLREFNLRLDSIYNKIYMFDGKTYIDKTIQDYADTLNNLPKNAPLPNFLIHYFDDISHSPFIGLHDYDTFRERLFKKITNRTTLNKIIHSKVKSLDEKGYSEFTIRQLARKRFKELKKTSP